MVAINQIERFGESIGREFPVERVILFGSYSEGTADADSDVDLLIIGSFEGRPVDTSVKIRMKLRPQFPVDLLVRTPEMVNQRLNMGDNFIRDILENGKVLYEADNR
ncbi:MAG: nucleotidyltransferase domain-containing protein [Sedimentisphaerales bacterium]|nr:nucleotidyltransferase domain-containing protein [Sedimentisphaerales bacterium]